MEMTKSEATHGKDNLINIYKTKSMQHVRRTQTSDVCGEDRSVWEAARKGRGEVTAH